jgi:TATA-box binding protein (TBP) (component of TFIID and TFIIIB)
MNFEEDFEKEFMDNLANLDKKKNDLHHEDAQILQMVKKLSTSNGNQKDKIIPPYPEPSDLSISTRSGMCNIGGLTIINEEGEEENKKISLHLGKLITNISEKIFDNFFKKNKKYPIKGIVTDNLIIHYDDAFIEKNKIPYVKFNEQQFNPYIKSDCENLIQELKKIEESTLTKQGRQKEKKDNEHFYNSCSLIVKPNKNIKCINVKLFNNGKITLTGSKEESDGYKACCVLLDELKKDKDLFINETSENIEKLEILNFDTTMINSNYSLNFKLDLDILFNCIEKESEDIAKVYDSDKYRGLKIGYFWNDKKGNKQDGICKCSKKCKGKGKGTQNGECKKVTIAVFKSGSIIITGGRTNQQTYQAYDFLNNLVKKYYEEIMKVSIVDLVQEKNKSEEIDLELVEIAMQRELKAIERQLKGNVKEEDLDENENKKKRKSKPKKEEIESLNSITTNIQKALKA